MCVYINFIKREREREREKRDYGDVFKKGLDSGVCVYVTDVDSSVGKII